jgi:hypothetical protein
MRILIPFRYLMNAHNALDGWRRTGLRVALFELCVLLGMMIAPQIQGWFPRRVVHPVDMAAALRRYRSSLGDPRRDPRGGAAAPPLRLQDASGRPLPAGQLEGSRLALVFAEGST